MVKRVIYSFCFMPLYDFIIIEIVKSEDDELRAPLMFKLNWVIS